MFKKGVEILESDLKEHSVWFTFYEPDELELLEALGIDVIEFQKELDTLKPIDEYWFPLPEEAISMPFKYLYLSSNVRTSGGTELIGYRTRVSLSVLHKGKCYYFNKSATALCKPQENELSAALKESKIFPVSVKILANNENEQFTY